MKKVFQISFNSENKVGYLLIYLLLLFKTGWFFHENLTGATSFLLLVMACVLLQGRGRHIKMNCVLPCAVVLLFQTITWMLGGVPEISTVVSSVLDFVIAIVIVSIYAKEKFLCALCDLIILICIASLIAWLLNILFPAILRLFPTISSDSSTRFAFLTCIPYYWDSLSVFDTARVQGIFWEPGVFQFFINLSLIVNYYRDYRRKNEKRTRLIILLISLFLTYSTVGWLCGAVVLLLYLKSNSFFSTIIIPLYLVTIVVAYIYFSTATDGYLYYALYTKVDDMANYQFGDDNTSSVRMESIIYPLRHMVENPLVGLSMEEKNKFTSMLGHSMLTCTPVNYLSFYGIFCGAFCFALLYKFIRSIGRTTLEVVVISLTLIIATSTEQLAFNTVLSIIMLYGYLEYKRIRRYEKNTHP